MIEHVHRKDENGNTQTDGMLFFANDEAFLPFEAKKQVTRKK